MTQHRRWYLELKVQDVDQDFKEHILASGDVDISYTKEFDDHGYNPNSGNSVTMGNAGEWYVELDTVEISTDAVHKVPLENQIHDIINMQILEELDDGRISEDEVDE
tara:strand:+ start:2516 stop:2836 length:321 start_codon:yes stop_codon:yes gene_type:complete